MVKKTFRRNGDPYNGDPASHITSCQKRIEEVLISGLKLQVLTCHSNLQNWKGKKNHQIRLLLLRKQMIKQSMEPKHKPTEKNLNNNKKKTCKKHVLIK